MRRMIITGATSMLGAALTNECIRRGTEVVAIAHRGSKKLSAVPRGDLVTLIEADLGELCAKDLPESDALCHFGWAGTSREQRNDPNVQCENIAQTLCAARLACECGCKVFLGAGSQAEYGKVDGRITTETRVQPLTCYGTAKFAAGKLSRRFCDDHGILHVWTRIFSVYGPHDGESTMIKYALRCFSEGGTAHFSAAVQPWNYLHERDAAKLFYLLCERAKTSGVYNVASDDTRPLKSFIEEMRAVAGDAKCDYAPSSPDVIGLDPDISETLAAVGEMNFIPFSEGIAEMLPLYKRAGDKA